MSWGWNKCGIIVVCATASVLAAQAQPSLVWTAYNDQYAGAATSPFATAWNVFGTTEGAPGDAGPLRNVLTGEELAARLTITSSGAIGQGTTSGSPEAGTPAYQVFNGYIDWTSRVNPSGPQIYPGAEENYTFTGLDPERRYTFVGTSVRGGNYPGRWTQFDLLGARSFTPAHTTGSAIYTNGLTPAQVALNSGRNGDTGDYVAWESIEPAADGSFTVRGTCYLGPVTGGTASGPYGYGLMALRLQEFNLVPSPPSFTLQPTNATVLETAPATFRAEAKGNPTPTYQWYRDGVAIEGATNKAYRLASTPASAGGGVFYAVASNWITNVAHHATSEWATLTVVLDSTPPTLLQTLPAVGLRISRLHSIEAFFSEPVRGVEAADLRINEAPATNVQQVTPAQYLFEFPQPPTGQVRVAWSPNHGIRDASAAGNPFAGGAWDYTLDTNVNYSYVRINEFLAGNKSGIRDEDGEKSDWIELYNSESAPVPLAGCYLTDDLSAPRKWRFPAVSVPAGGYLLVWSSGKDRAAVGAPLHANFQLNKSGGSLALVAPDGQTVVSSFTPTYPPQYTDVSYGCDRAEPSLRGYFQTPTPGAANSTRGAGFGPEVSFSRESGTFTKTFPLTLGTTASNAVIRYTLGTNLPTASSPIYTGPITMDRTLVVRARAFLEGLMPGEVASRDYVLLNPGTPAMTTFKSTLPVLVFHNYGGGSVPASESDGGYAQFALLQVFEPKDGHSSLTNIPDLTVKATIHRRGQATLWNPKPSLRVETQDEYGGDKDVSLAGYPADSDWVLYGINGYDKVLMHNPLAHQLYRQLGRYSSRTRFVEVYIKQDYGDPGPLTEDDYYGLYVLEEKIKFTEKRVDVPQLQPENTNAPSITGGYLFSVDKDGPSPGLWAANSYLRLLNPDGPTLYTAERSPQLNYLNNYLDSFYSALTGPDWTNPVTGYRAYIDVPAWIDYHLHQVLMFNADMLRISSYWCKPREGKLRPAALWDFDRAFGMSSADGDQRGFNPWRWRSGAGDYGTDPFNPADIYDNPWYGRLFRDPDFWQQYLDRYQELRQSVYSFANVTALIDKLGTEVAEATPREYARWTGWGNSDTSPNRGTVRGDGWTYTFPSPGTWEGQVQFVKVWFTNRLTFMDTNFLAMPTVSAPAGLLTSGSRLTLAPADKADSWVVYTLNGADPRLAGGAIAPYAFSNLGPVTLTLTSNVNLCARSWNSNHRNLTGANRPPLSSPWSGATRAVYWTALPALRVTEVMYHPGRPSADDPYSADAYEYIELKNTGTNGLSLPGFRLSGGVEYAFTAASGVTRLEPGERVLVVKSRAAFESRFAALAARVAGEYDGQLNNAGDTLELLGPADESIQRFTFNNSWYPLTDGLGFSLVAVDETASGDAGSTANQWRASTYAGGSPGTTEDAPIAVPPVLVNEVLPNPVAPGCDTIELWNPNATAVDIGYWWLTDNRSVPQKYCIPAGTVMPAFGFAVFYKTNTFGAAGPIAGLNREQVPFGLSPDGEDVYLFSGDSRGRLTGYYQGFDYGPAAPGVSVGRHVTSQGETRYSAQIATTLGATNAGPRVGPVVISQIMYHPPNLSVGGTEVANTRDEFIELDNLTDQPMPLYDPERPAYTWAIQGGVTYPFPAGWVLPPYGYLVLVGFSPEADPVARAAFLARYGLADNAPLVGPYQGQLNNAGERIELRRPGQVNLQTQTAPMILVDRVEYSPAAPWPTLADGLGASLHRIDAHAYGNDPANWTAADPSPVGLGAPVAVHLAIRMQSSNLVIAWEDSSQTWSLEESGDLTAGESWRTVPETPERIDGEWRVVRPLGQNAQRYFRLRSR